MDLFLFAFLYKYDIKKISRTILYKYNDVIYIYIYTSLYKSSIKL